MMQDFDGSLPSHSVFVPTDMDATSARANARASSNGSIRGSANGNANTSKTITPKPFLRKGSRKEPSAINRRGASSSPLSPDASAGTGSAGNASMDRSRTSMGHQHRSPIETHDRNGRRQNHIPNPDIRKSAIRQSRESDAPEATDALDTSIVSSSTFCFDDTSTIDLHQRWAQEQQQAQVELDEFVMIEQELHGLAVTPLLMTSSEMGRGEAFSALAGGKKTHHSVTATIHGSQKVRRSTEEHDLTFKSGQMRVGIEPESTVKSDTDEPNLYDQDFDDYEEYEDEVDSGTHAPGEDNSWVQKPASYFMGESQPDRSGFEEDSWSREEQRGLTNDKPSLQGGMKGSLNGNRTFSSTNDYDNLHMVTDDVDACSSYASTHGPNTQTKSTVKAAVRPQIPVSDEDFAGSGSDKSRQSANEFSNHRGYVEGRDNYMSEEDEHADNVRYRSSDRNIVDNDVRNSVDVDDSRSWGDRMSTNSPPARETEEYSNRQSKNSLRYSSGGVVGSGGNGAIGGGGHHQPPSDGHIARKSQTCSQFVSDSVKRAVREVTTGEGANRRAVRPLSGGRTRTSTAKPLPSGKTTDSVTLADDVGPRLAKKAKELEQEIETYKKENAALKHVRKQQEHILAEIEQQRNELKKWIEGEKKKTAEFCNESKEAAARERRAAAKYARDTKAAADAGNSGPNRKERAEIEALKATIHKLKADHEEAQKKWKSNSARLQQTCKESASVISKLQEQVEAFEEEKAKIVEKKKKKSRDYFSPTAKSYATEEVASNEMDVYIEQTSNSSNGMITSTSRSGTTVPASHRDVNPTVDVADEFTIRNSRNHSDTLNSEILEYGTLNDYDDVGVFDGTMTGTGGGGARDYYSPLDESRELRHGTVDNLRSERRQDQDRNSIDHPPPYDPSKYLKRESSQEGDYSKNGRMGITDSVTSVATDVTCSSEHVNVGGSLPRSNSDMSSRSSPKRISEITPDGVKVTKYSNGTVKKLHPDGQQEVKFLNGDTKVTYSSGTVVYYYANAQTTHTTYVDGSEVYEFPNNQVEKHYADGRKEIIFPNKTKKTIYPNQYEESVFADGVVVREYPDGRKEVIKPHS